MAGDSTLDSELFVIRDWWPDAPMLRIGDLPPGGLMGITQQNVATPAYELGTKLLLWNDGDVAGADGWSTLIYLQADLSAPHTGIVQQVFVPQANTAMFVVSPDPEDVLLVAGSPLMGISLSVMVDGYYGWFWCGGVAPESHCAVLGGNYLTEGTVTVGPMSISDSLTADNICFSLVAAKTEAIAAYSLSADAE